jgi:hypothetical protein
MQDKNPFALRLLLQILAALLSLIVEGRLGMTQCARVCDIKVG